MSLREFSDKRKNSTKTSIRFPIDLLDEFKAKAKEEGLMYQTLLKRVLIQYLRGDLPNDRIENGNKLLSVDVSHL